MKQIVLISGKGGTGKTVLTASLAVLSENAIFADCDVDAADLHLLLNPEIIKRYKFKSGNTARIDKKLCQECSECINICRFNAVSDDFIIDSISCEGCGICCLICPAEAIKMVENESGEWFISNTKYGTMVHARLGIAEENSGKLVALVRTKAKEIAEEQNRDYIIIDGPPGIGCPVIASLADVDLALIVTEPTLSGIHNMERIAGVARHFGVIAKVIINKYDINLKNTEDIKKICKDRDIEVLAKLPYSDTVIKSLVRGVPLIEYCDDDITRDIKTLWYKVK